MRPIFVLQGYSGHYSDRSDWIVRAYASEEKAKAAQKELQDEALRIEEKYKKDAVDTGYCTFDAEERGDYRTPLDPHFDGSRFNPTFYVLETISLEED